MSKKYSTGVYVDRVKVRAAMTADEEREYRNIVSPHLGGRNPAMGPKDFRDAMRLCLAASTREMVSQVRRLVVARGIGVFVVAANTAHQEELKRELLAAMPGALREADVALIRAKQSLHLTPASKDRYKVVVTTVQHSLGYTLTQLGAMVTSVYPMNNATAEQLDRRVDRIGQAAKTLEYVTVHCGLQSHIMLHHLDARNISLVLQSIAHLVNSESSFEDAAAAGGGSAAAAGGSSAAPIDLDDIDDDDEMDGGASSRW